MAQIDTSVAFPQKRRLVTAVPGPRSLALHARRTAAVAQGLSTAFPVYIESGSGAVLRDVDGNTLIDLGSGIAVTGVGHAADAVVDAVREQVGRFSHTCFMVEQAELNLGYTRVVSLVDGIAGINTVQVGNLVGPSTVLTAVSQVSPIKVYFPISEQEYLRMADGGSPGSVDFLTHASRIPLQLTLADGSVYPHPGRIIFADRQVNTQTGTIQIVGEFPNSRNLLRPGQYARVQTPTGNITGALLVPQAAVNQQQGTYQVTVIGADNRAQLRTVEVGPRVGTLWVITTGLKPGERVVAVGAEKAKEGELVNPTPYKETEER